jgi:hypothetical protein
MPELNGVFGIYDIEGNFVPYLGSSAIDNEAGGLVNWRIRSENELAVRPLRPGDLIFFHATRQRDGLNKKEIEVKSEAGEFLPGFYTTSGTNLNDSIKLGWYWYECPTKTDSPKKDWHVIAFVLRKAHVESSLTSLFVRDTCRYYLQEPRLFVNGGANADAKDLKAIEFANKNGQVMIFPDKTTKLTCNRDGSRVSLDEFVLGRTGLDKFMEYAVIVGLQKPPPLDMRQQCWVSPNGLWHINQAERYEVFSRGKDLVRFAQIKNFVDQNSKK